MPAHPRTMATLDRLYQSEWFANVAVRDTEVADVLSSWREAIESCSSAAWQGQILEAANQLCERLLERSPERFAKWNDLVNEIRPVTRALVEEKTAKVVAEHRLPKVFVDTVRWDMIHVCMEAEYADVFPPAYFASQAYWYTKGHFPCGWRGEFPKGTLVIY